MKKLFTKSPSGNVLAMGLQQLPGPNPTPGAATGTVLRDERGVPTAWRLFAYGPFTLTRDAITWTGEFLPEHAAAIVAYFRTKGARVPIDSEHYLYRLAEKLNVSETEALATLPGGRAAMAYGELEQRDDGLWVTNVEWGPFAYELMAELIYRYFSPVLRGLSDGRLRITSIAMVEVPAIDRQESQAPFGLTDNIPGGMPAEIAASAEDSGDQGGKVPLYAHTGAGNSPNRKGAAMKKLLVLLGAIVGQDALALSAEGEAPAELLGKLETLKTELPRLRSEAAIAANVRDALALGAEVDAPALTGKLQALIQKAEGHDALKARVDALELTAETEKRQALIAGGLKSGKLTPALVEKWAGKQDSVALAAYLDAAPVLVAPGSVINPETLRPADSVALTAEDEAVAAHLGLTKEQMLAQKKANATH